jgi:hypothetical protein
MPDPTQPNGSSSDSATEKRSMEETSASKTAATVESAPSASTVGATLEHHPSVGEVNRNAPDRKPGQDGAAASQPSTVTPTVQLLTDRIGIEIHSPPFPKGFGRGFLRVIETLGKDYGALITGLASLVITIIIALLASSISTKQNQILDRQAEAAIAQAKTAEDEINEKFIEEFKNHLNDLTLGSTSENLRKKRLAAITLAQYGERALPALKISLAVNEEDIREGAAVVVAQMLSDKSVRGSDPSKPQKPLRASVLSKLQDYFDEDNAPLRVGVLECYITINTGLTDDEFEQARKKVSQYVNPWANYANKPEQQRVLLWAVKFFGYWARRSSKDFLLAVTSNTTCGDDAREGALNYLDDVTKGATDINDEERKVIIQEVSKTLQGLIPSASERLRTNLEAAIANLQNP